MNLEGWKDTALKCLALVIAGFIGNELKEMRTSVVDLNRNVAIVITRQAVYDENQTKVQAEMKDHDERLRAIENSRRRN